MRVHDFFRDDSVDVGALSAWLDGLDDETRVREVGALDRREQALLFDAAGGFRPITLTDFVPSGTTPLAEVIHAGRNSLPVFRFFEKRFCLPSGENDKLWGYNEQPWKNVTGPGYFVARPAPDGEVIVDYCLLPPERPDGWPEILPNSARLSRFIYHRMQDVMRGVSRHVTIGRATRDGKTLDNWFVLCRREARH